MARTWWPRSAARATMWAPMPPEAPKTVMFMVRCSCWSRPGSSPVPRGWPQSSAGVLAAGRGVCVVTQMRLLVGQFRRGNPVVAHMDVIGGRGRLAAGVGGAQPDDGGGKQEERAGQQGALETTGKRFVRPGVRGEQGAGTRGGDGGEDRQAERGAELLGGSQQARGESGLVRRDTSVGGGGDGDQD